MTEHIEVEQTFLLVNVVEKNTGEIEMETTDGEATVEEVVVLTLRTMDPETMAIRNVDLAIPRSCGPDLLMNLLTADQFDAAISA